MGKLTDRHCRNLTAPGKYADGHGLYLHVTAKGRYWRAAYRFDGKQKTASFGVYPRVRLKDARALHAHFLADLAQGIDPNAARKAAKTEECTEERANDNLTDLLETFARMAEDWQQLQPYQQNTPANDVARALSTLSILAGNVLAELATIREHIAWAKESGVAP